MNNEDWLRLRLARLLPERPLPKVKPSNDRSDVGEDENKSSSVIDQGKGKSLYQAGVAASSRNETRLDLAAELRASALLRDEEILQISCFEHQELLRQRALGLSERKPSDDRGTSLDLAAERRISALLGDDEILWISRREYEEWLHRQVLWLSEIKPSDDRGDVGKSLHQAESSSSGNDKARSNESEPTSFVCGICWDESPSSQIFTTRSCSHSFCTQCMGMYVATRIQENVTSIKCPGEKCWAILDPQTYLQIISRDVAELRDRVLCESLIPDSQKYYCPFRNCSALLVDDGGQVLTSCQCPICNRLFCVQCKVPWHSGFNCEEFQRTKDSELDRMATDLAKIRRWKKCPNCNFYIEKSSGCRHMTCRCGLRFCYTCGKKDCNCVFV